MVEPGGQTYSRVTPRPGIGRESQQWGQLQQRRRALRDSKADWLTRHDGHAWRDYENEYWRTLNVAQCSEIGPGVSGGFRYFCITIPPWQLISFVGLLASLFHSGVSRCTRCKRRRPCIDFQEPNLLDYLDFQIAALRPKYFPEFFFYFCINHKITFFNVFSSIQRIIELCF